MKIRFYFNDFALYADIEWDLHILPNKSEVVFIKDLINLEENTTNVKAIEPLEGSRDEFIFVSVYRGRARTDKAYLFLKNAPCVVIESSPIWRILVGKLTPCFSVCACEPPKILDALYTVHSVDDI